MNNQWFGIRWGILIYVISCFFNPALTEILPSKLLDNTEWVFKSEDCQHDTVSSYELNFNFRVFKNRVEMTGTWENDGGRSGDTRAFGAFNAKTGILNLKNRSWEFKGKFYPKENTTYFKGKFSDHPLDCEIIEGQITGSSRDLFSEAKIQIEKVRKKKMRLLAEAKQLAFQKKKESERKERKRLNQLAELKNLKKQLAEAKQKAAEEAKRRAIAEAKRKAAEEAKRRAIAAAKKKAAEEARRQAIAEAKRKAAEEAKKLDWNKRGRPIDKSFKQRKFGKRIVILLPSEDILELKAEKNSVGRVSGLKVFAGCKYDDGILINFLGSGVRTEGFDLISNKVTLFGNKGNRIRFNFQRNVHPDRFIEFRSSTSKGLTIAGETDHNRYKNGQIRTDLSKRDKEFFVNNYGCLAQRNNLKVVFRKRDLMFFDSNKKVLLQSSDILFWPFTLREDPMDPNTKPKGVRVQFD